MNLKIFKNQIKTIAISLMLTQTAVIASCQKQIAIKAVVQEFRQLQDNYNKQGVLQFNIKYTYSNESTPDILLDSLNGKIKMESGNYWTLLDSTETISNPRYSVILFRKDKIMYLTKPNKNQLMFDPVNALDSALVKMQGVECTIFTNRQNEEIAIIFPEGQPYKKITFVIDKVTGFMTKSIYILKTELLSGSGQAIDDLNKQGYEDYARMEAMYDHYTRQIINESIFDEKTYFFKENKNYVPTAAYKGYHIFLGTPNL